MRSIVFVAWLLLLVPALAAQNHRQTISEPIRQKRPFMVNNDREQPGPRVFRRPPSRFLAILQP